jgi:hypothetical protein
MMTIKELDLMCGDVNLEQMVNAIGLDFDDFAHFAWQQTGGKIHPTNASNLTRIAALIGFMYGKQQGGTDGQDETKATE